MLVSVLAALAKADVARLGRLRTGRSSIWATAVACPCVSRAKEVGGA
jgi:hypothetical protein